MDPLVSVVITTYNLGWCIEDTLRCVFAQTYKNIEIIVVDDASTDDTPVRMAPFLGRVKYLRHPTNQGIAMQAEGGPARNTGIRQAVGEFIAFLDGDDLWEPEKLAVQVDAAQRFPHAGLIVVDGVSFAHQDGVILRSTLLHDYGDTFCSSLPEGSVLAIDLYYRFLQGCMIDTPSQVMVPTHVFRAIGVFDPCRADDYDFWIRVVAKFDVVLVKRRLVRYRCHATSLSGPLDRQFFHYTPINITIWEKHLRNCRPDSGPFVRRQIKKTLMRASERACEEGQLGNKTWASHFLWGLLKNNLWSPGFPYVALSLTRLWCPQWVASTLRPLTRRILRRME